MDDKFKNTTIGELMAAQKQAQMEEPVSWFLSEILKYYLKDGAAVLGTVTSEPMIPNWSNVSFSFKKTGILC